MARKIRNLCGQAIIYGFFVALGTGLAEVLSYNYTQAIIVPWGSLPYGLLYVLFIDTLFKRRVRDWKVVYLFGVLVGFITEGFAAKVVFFGWNDDSTVLLGFAPAETMYLTFVFHPLVSFILPVFIARNFYDFPFALPKAKRPWLVSLIVIPLYVLIMGANNGIEFLWIVVYMLLTFLFFGIWTALLRLWGEAESVALGKITRAFFLILTLAFYVFAWFFFDTGYRTEALFPPWPATVVSILFTLFVFVLIGIKIDRPTTAQVAYTPKFPYWKRTGYCMLLTVLLILAAINPLAALFRGLFVVTFVLGIGLGPIYFGYVVVDAMVRRVARLLGPKPRLKECWPFGDGGVK